MFKRLKEQIEELCIMIEDHCAEKRLERYIKSQKTRWRLEWLKFPEREIMKAYGEEEWRN